VINCLLIGNWADYEGGGVGGDAAGQGRLYRCTLTENTAYHGGGTAYTILSDCLVVSNRLWTAGGGGGTHWSTLYNCTVIGNSAGFDSGVHGGSVYNSIVYHNVPEDHGSGKFYYSCTTPLPVGPGNLELEPAFVDAAAGDFRLHSNSICINAGRNSHVARPADLSGAPRIVGGTVDMGAYEHQAPSSTLSYAWAAQHGLPIDGSADHTDHDGDGMSNWAEWRSATNPTNAASVLKVSSVGTSSAGAGTLITWQSVGGVLYSVERSSMLSGEPTFVPIASDIVGLTETTTYVDSMPSGGGARFYRIRAGD
jgi:hypothetical protein